MTSIKERTEIAKENRRDVPSILEEIRTLATLSSETALSCFYVVFDKTTNKPFTGISVRFAELIASCWGNIHTGAKIMKNNGMSVTVQGFVHDFEKNAVFTVEVQRSLARMSAEKSMQATNAASSIAFRNAIFKAIPAAVTANITKEVKQYIVENIDGKNLIDELLAYFKSKGVSDLEVKKLIEPISVHSEQVFLLIGLRNAIEEGDTTIEEVFDKPMVKTNLRPSKFDMDIELIDPVSEEVITIGKVKDSKETLKDGLSHLAEPSPSLESDNEIEEETKKPPVIKRKRGRPKGSKNKIKA